MARRSSARLRDKASTPKRVSLSHDAPSTSRTPRTVPTKLTSVEENDEMPGAFPRSVSPSSSMMVLNPTVPEGLKTTTTPSKATPIQPSEKEMHPQLYHQSTAKPRDEARHLGFSNMAPHTEPPKRSGVGALQGTPTRTRDIEADVKSPSFHFTFRREHSLELSPAAKKLMYEKREEAAKIRDQMVADGEPMPSIDEVLAARKLAKPTGRYSSVHLKQFEKMDSIANHASSFRSKPMAPPTKDRTATTASLKRSPSKAGLDQPSSTPSSRPSSRDATKPLPATPGSQLPRSTSLKDLKNSSPAKRLKRTDTDDVSTARPTSGHEDKALPSTPQSVKKPSYPDLSHLTTPTQSSLARAASVKFTKTTKIPAPSFTPAKAPQLPAHEPIAHTEHSTASPALLARSPSKASLFPRFDAEKHAEKPGQPASLLLMQSPTKQSNAPKKAAEVTQGQAPSTKTPFLSRSPLKAAVTKSTGPDAAISTEKTGKVPFLARSPSKLPVSNIVNEETEIPGKSMSNKLFGRFNLLRQSPMKSILRSPQRLYSDDPAKVAAGTHMSTPPKLTMEKNPTAPASAFVSKHVDFSSSTKAGQEKAQSSTPFKTPTPSPQPERYVQMPAEPENVRSPDLTEKAVLLSPSPQKRRQTSGPQDFTFRAGDQGIVFGQVPAAKASTTQSKRPSTIRMVSADVTVATTGSKKRKFEFENKQAATSGDVDMASEKENTPVAADQEEGRPAKRVKSGDHAKPDTAAKAASASVRTTLGVKPKGAKTTSSPVKRPSTISQARLAALSQPKKRG